MNKKKMEKQTFRGTAVLVIIGLIGSAFSTAVWALAAVGLHIVKKEYEIV